MSDKILSLRNADWQENQNLVLQMYVEFPQRIQTDHNITYKYFEKFLDKEFEAVADIGCANRPFYEQNVKARLTAAIDPLLVDFQELGYEIPYQKSAPFMYGVPTSFFDGLFCLNSLGYFVDIDYELSQILRVLEEGGFIFLTHDFGDDFSLYFFDKEELTSKLNSIFQPVMLKVIGSKLYYVGTTKDKEDERED